MGNGWGSAYFVFDVGDGNFAIRFFVSGGTRLISRQFYSCGNTVSTGNDEILLLFVEVL